MTFTALCCEHSGFYQLQKVRALRKLMQSHLCPAMDPILVQPHITRTLPPASSALGVCPDQTPKLLSTQFTILSTQLTLLSTQLTHLLQPFMDTPPPTSPPPTTTFTKQLQVLKQTGFLAVCSHQPFQFICTPTRCPAVLALWGSFLTPVCLCILVPLFQSQGAVPQDTEGRWKMESAFPSCSSRGRPCPLSPLSPQWVCLTIYESPCHPSEKAVAPHSSTVAWKIPRTKEPGRLQSLGSLRVRHN